MKWGHIDEVESSQKLLYWVLMFVLAPYFDDPVDHWLKDIITHGGGLGGDPGWEIEHIPELGGAGSYRVWADPDMSGIKPADIIYSAKAVHHAVQESLLALGDSCPEKADEVKAVAQRYKL